MEKVDILILLSKILQTANIELEIVELISSCSSLSKSELKVFFSSLKESFSSPESSSFTRLQSVRVLKSLMLLNKSAINSLVQKEMVSTILDFISSHRPWEGFHVWLRLLDSSDKQEFKTYILLLQCLENWAEEHPTDRQGLESAFFKAFQSLKEKNTQFPPSFFLMSLDSDKVKLAKRDFKRVSAACKEFMKFLACLSKNSSFLLRKILISYEKSLKEISKVESYKKQALSKIEKINNLMKVFQVVKANRFSKLPENAGDFKIFRIIEDPAPKALLLPGKNFDEECEEKPDCVNDRVLKRSCTSRCLSNHSKIRKYKEKIKYSKENQQQITSKYNELLENHLKVLEDVEALTRTNQDLLKKCQRFEEKEVDSHILIDDKTNQVAFLEKEVKKNKQISEKLKIRMKNLENSLKISQAENENHRKFILDMEIENSVNEFQSSFKNLKPRDKEPSMKKLSSKRILEKARVTAINFRSPNFAYLYQKEPYVSTFSDSESEKVSNNETIDLKMPNISLDLTEKYYKKPQPSKSSRVSKH
jgi:hypothetical protein